MADLAVLKEHHEEYKTTSRAAVQQLEVLFADLELSEQEQTAELQECCRAACDAWTQAVDSATRRRQALADKMQEMKLQIATIQLELGDAAMSEHGDAACDQQTTKALHAHVAGRLAHWQSRRMERMTDYLRVAERMAAVSTQVGMPFEAPGEPDLSLDHLGSLKLDIAKLEVEAGRRRLRLDALMESLGSICETLGEDLSLTAAGVHLSLKTHPDAGVNLSDVTLAGLRSKMEELEAVREQRKAKLEGLELVLKALWGALKVSEEAPERAALEGAMAGPQRLHGAVLDACVGEVTRLEGAKAAAMKEVTLAKVQELKALCEATHLPCPPVDALVATVHNSPAVADVLGKVLHAMGEVAAAKEKRAPLVAQVLELEEALGEACWLREYNQDEDRFKGRDANRKLQRSIRAAKVRDRLPDMLEAATAALAAWATATGGPFLFDGEDFAATRLPGYRAEVEALVQARAEGRERARAKASPGGGDVGAARADRTSSSRRSSDAGWNSSTATRPASATPQAASRQPSGGGATPASAASRPGSAAKIRSAVKTPPTAKAPASDAKGTADDQCASNIPTPVAITYT